MRFHGKREVAFNKGYAIGRADALPPVLQGAGIADALVSRHTGLTKAPAAATANRR